MRGGRAARSTPPVARYVADGVAEFTFDRSAGRPLLRFEGSREVLVLFPAPGPRGDINFKNDVGQTVLKITGLGGVTVFTQGRPEGAPAAVAGDAEPIRFDPIRDMRILERNLSDASIRITNEFRRATGQRVQIEAPDFGPESGALIVDALNLTAQAIQRTAGADRSRLAAVRKIEIVEGATASVALDGGVLRISVASNRGLAGRPSSERIAVAIR